MVFGPFIGIDNHGKSITFAAALLDKENSTNFSWLFEVFLRIMGQPLKCIITDQCPAMRTVIPNIFPKSTLHRFCMWHIVRKFSSKVDVILDTQNVTCSCKMFTRIGYPFRHTFYCLSACGIHRIPRDLLSKRWMKNAEEMLSTLGLGENSKSCSKEGKVKAKSQDVWFEFQGCIGGVSGDEDLLEYVLLELKSLREKIQEKSKKKPTNSKADVAENLIGVKPADVITVHPPHQSNNKGSKKRMLSSLEKSLDGRKRPTRYCRSYGVLSLHDSRHCPVKGNGINHQFEEVIEEAIGEKEHV